MELVAAVEKLRDQLRVGPSGPRRLERKTLLALRKPGEVPQHDTPGRECRALRVDPGKPLGDHVGVDKGGDPQAASNQRGSYGRLSGTVRVCKGDGVGDGILDHESLPRRMAHETGRLATERSPRSPAGARASAPNCGSRLAGIVATSLSGSFRFDHEMPGTRPARSHEMPGTRPRLRTLPRAHDGPPADHGASLRSAPGHTLRHAGLGARREGPLHREPAHLDCGLPAELSRWAEGRVAGLFEEARRFAPQRLG